MNEQEKQKMLELLSDKAVFGLTNTELTELTDLTVAALPVEHWCAGTPNDFWQRQDRIAGCLLGSAVGNALGRAIRFQPVDAGPAIDAGGRLATAMFRGGRLIVADHASALLAALARRLAVSASGSGGYAEPAPGYAYFPIGVDVPDPVLAGALVGIGAVPDLAEWASR